MRNNLKPQSAVTLDSKVKCCKCGKEATVNFSVCLRLGWPKCCGLTMTLTKTNTDIEDSTDSVIEAQIYRQTGKRSLVPVDSVSLCPKLPISDQLTGARVILTDNTKSRGQKPTQGAE